MSGVCLHSRLTADNLHRYANLLPHLFSAQVQAEGSRVDGVVGRTVAGLAGRVASHDGIRLVDSLQIHLDLDMDDNNCQTPGGYWLRDSSAKLLSRSFITYSALSPACETRIGLSCISLLNKPD